MSACGDAVAIDTDAVLSSVSGSLVLDVAVAVLARTRPPGAVGATRPTTVMVIVAPDASAGAVHCTTSPVAVQFAPGASALSSSMLGSETASVATTFTASDGPSLCTVTVYVVF